MFWRSVGGGGGGREGTRYIAVVLAPERSVFITEPLWGGRSLNILYLMEINKSINSIPDSYCMRGHHY